eukprot:CAMPEP_0174324014 /NCGR_PEP_ID=MMETSP0810-20121108/12205_1 /TAXON_ID=73025 ORGANISM="Eutreptiella gymnastica-like, Strain CCMP1594" /NCGR_SAMPLE_ID=MMETSP0810 /ASSEMBLY_ACC=CAM_ASM_000659 /LENGTH=67 /DNA_ID=CAMNT_0015436661 /DNA_START=441 /DNA_END=645 /DNA_ORIENTATION=+
MTKRADSATAGRGGCVLSEGQTRSTCGGDIVSVRAWRYMFSTAAADCYVVAEIRFESQNTADVAAFK